MLSSLLKPLPESGGALKGCLVVFGSTENKQFMKPKSMPLPLYLGLIIALFYGFYQYQQASYARDNS